MASDPEIKDGFTLPAWMKTKPVKDYEPFAASPPAADDAFFYIKYPKSDVIFGKTKIEPNFREVLKDPPTVSGAHYTPQERDWSKHTKPCQDVIHGLSKSGSTSGLKSKDDGKQKDSQNEGASCGSSVVKVAQQMVVSSQRGFTVASASLDDEEGAAALRGRRGSRSLPVTPLHSPPGSPNSRRRKVNNRYFTSPFEPVGDGSTRSWLTMALLGYKKDIGASTSTLAEEDAIEARLQGASLAESVENLGPAPMRQEPTTLSNPTPPQSSTAKTHVFRPKPSELREMNFWSPTSM